jgi:ribosomal protein S18 acetylase RimI-like enzyme
MKIRPYKNQDWEAVNKIYNLAKPDEMKGSVDLRALIPLEDDKNNLKLFHDSRIIVVEERELILGFGGYRLNYISWLFVHPDHRRKGVGQMLLNQVLSRLAGTIKLNVAKNNIAAKKLYEKHGFKIEREFVGNFNGFESQAMTLILEKSS